MQAGRAGRSGRPCVSVLVGLAGALDQYWMQHPDELFGSQPEDVTIDPANPCILALQMVAAASELPLTEEDAAGFGGSEMFYRTLQQHVHDGVLAKTTVDPELPRWEYIAMEQHPQGRISLRGSSMHRIQVQDERGREVETVDLQMACKQLHGGAVYLHQTRSARFSQILSRVRLDPPAVSRA